MSDYIATADDGDVAVVVDRQILKGRGILDLCLTRGSNLCMKGFIDSQIEQGEAYIPVVEQMVTVINRELEQVKSTSTRALLLDLHSYADAQLRALATVWQGPPGEG